MKKQLISKIQRYFTVDCVDDLWGVFKKRFPSNNHKNKAILETLRAHGLKFRFLGPGTNRTAILIDGTVFKIAFDNWGINSNRVEFAYSPVLQPYVVKTYEFIQGGLIIAQEYITPMDKLYFHERGDDIKDILSKISQHFIIGDAALLDKNHVNWGYRAFSDQELNNGDAEYSELAILDFGELYKVTATDAMCNTVINDEGERCDGFLEYNDIYSELFCPKCHRKFSHLEIRRRLDRSDAEKEIDEIIESRWKLTTQSVMINVEDEEEEEQELTPLEEFKRKYEAGEFHTSDDEGYDDPVAVEACGFYTYDAEHDRFIAPPLSEITEDTPESLARAERLRSGRDPYHYCKFIDDEFTLAKVFGVPMLLTDDYFHIDYEPECPEETVTKEGLPAEISYTRIQYADGTTEEFGMIGPDLLLRTPGSLMSYLPIVEDLGRVKLEPGDVEVDNEHTMTLREYIRQMKNLTQLHGIVIDTEYIDNFRNGSPPTPEKRASSEPTEEDIKMLTKLASYASMDISDIASELENEMRRGAVHDYSNSYDDDDDWYDEELDEYDDEDDDGCMVIKCDPAVATPLGEKPETFQLEIERPDGTTTIDVPKREDLESMNPITPPEQHAQLEMDLEQEEPVEEEPEDNSCYVKITLGDDDEEDDIDECEPEDPSEEEPKLYRVVSVFGVLMLYTPETDKDIISDITERYSLSSLQIIGNDVEQWEYLTATSTNQPLVGTLITLNPIGLDLASKRGRVDSMENIVWWDDEYLGIESFINLAKERNKPITFSIKYMYSYTKNHIDTDTCADDVPEQPEELPEDIGENDISVNDIPEPSEEMKQLLEDSGGIEPELHDEEPMEVDDEIDGHSIDELSDELDSLKAELMDGLEYVEPELMENELIDSDGEDEIDTDGLRFELEDGLREDEEESDRLRAKDYKRRKNNNC